jgi:predicted negative regulator of RcsB-dependent stress response
MKRLLERAGLVLVWLVLCVAAVAVAWDLWQASSETNAAPAPAGAVQAWMR